jgi:hypothetical protein
MGCRGLVGSFCFVIMVVACGRVDLDADPAGGSGATQREADDGDCRAGGGFCLTRNSAGSKGQGPATCGQAGSASVGAAYVDSPLHCDVGQCCVPPPVPVACLPLPNDPPRCDPAATPDAVTFASRAELEAFLRGSWMICAYQFFPGGYTDIEGLAFTGEGDSFAAHAVTWADGNTDCSIVNDDKYHRPTQLELIPATPGSDRWLVSLTMPSTGTLTIGSIGRKPSRITFAGGVQLQRVADGP